MSEQRDEGFIQFKKMDVAGGPLPCDDCRSCKRGLLWFFWIPFAVLIRTIGLLGTRRHEAVDSVNFALACPRCRHVAFWHSGAF